ncbi:hypothetical protein ACQW5G_04810 [Fructilactobacillus sp. Tb1]|uniref:hypothetical protein n=1 Tax=Fructilactobacillus sp. Tb1 TaxID=3422304 RepID=UPI003D277FA4
MNKFVIDVSQDGSNTANSKPKDDINFILSNNMGFNIIKLKKYKHDFFDKHLFIKTRINSVLDKISFKSGDIVIIQYPIYAGKSFEEYLIKYLKNKHLFTILLIHDIDTLRGYTGIFKDVKDEVNYINKYDAVIAHNNSMIKLLENNGLSSTAYPLDVFDYVTKDITFKNSSKYKYEITFAGNLNKSSFISKLEVKAPLEFNLYGNIDDKSIINDSLNYHGSVTPDVLANKMGKGFGLVWDGDEINTISGNLGDYLKYNNPYKLSSYLNSGMPVIVWDKSAVAKFVLDNKIGIVTSNINNLNDLINNVTDQEFEEMCENVKNISRKMKDGNYIMKAVNKVLND